ncbi:MAG: exosortase A [Sulfuriferula sp.]
MSVTIQPALPESTMVRGWPAVAAITIAAVITLLLIFYSTSASTVAIWDRSETYTHGFLIFPISAWLIWRRRSELACLAYQPEWRGLILLLLLSAGWLFAHSGGVLVGEQLMLVAMIPAAVWTILGSRAVWAMAFPLAFLLLAVPMGEALIPHLMVFTANFTVKALQLTGMPVYQEGTFFTTPTGQWSVVEGCSGLRYLIASFTLGTLYAYLTYRSSTRRILFAIAAIIVPVIANGLRAYMIVMIAVLSDMKLALGFDHLIYGWVFFGVVMLLLFWIGGFWREDEKSIVPTAQVLAHDAPAAPLSKVALAAILSIAVALTGHVYAAWLDGKLVLPQGLQIAPPVQANGWTLETTPFTDWHPHYVGPDAEHAMYYRKGNQQVMVYLAYYSTQRQGAEQITSQNYMIRQKDPEWFNMGETNIAPKAGAQPAEVIQAKLHSVKQNLLVWRWNQLDGRDTTNDYLAKLLLASERIMGRRDDGAAIVIATPYANDLAQAQPVLREFMHDMQPSIAASLRQVSRP